MNRRGFTLLEVMLFLAISAGLGAVALIGLGPRLANVRFSSAMRGLEQNLASQLSVQQAINNRSPVGSCEAPGSLVEVGVAGDGINYQAGTSKNCVLNGVVAIFDRGGSSPSILYRKIVSRREPYSISCTDSNPIRKIALCHRATVVAESTASEEVRYQYSGGIRPAGDPRINGDQSADVVGFGYLQDPNSTQRYYFIARQTSWFFRGALVGSSISADFDTNSTLDICYGLNSRRANVRFQNSEQKPVVEFNDTAKACQS